MKQTKNQAVTVENAVTYTQTENEVIIRIAGKGFENAGKIADALNATDWCSKDNTAATVLRCFVLNWMIGQLAEPPTYSEGTDSICEDIIYGIDTNVDGGTDEDKRRRDVLRAEFVARGLMVDNAKN